MPELYYDCGESAGINGSETSINSFIARNELTLAVVRLYTIPTRLNPLPSTNNYNYEKSDHPVNSRLCRLFQCL